MKNTLRMLVLLAMAVCCIGCGGDAPSGNVPTSDASDGGPGDAAHQAADVQANVRNEPAAKPAVEAPVAGRQWKSPSGDVLAVGEFVSLMGDKVCLETPDGLGAVVPLASLCEADRAFVDSKTPSPTVDETVEAESDLPEAEQAADDVVVDSRGDLKAPPVDESAYYSDQKVVIPFDFESKFDDGRYGKMVGDMLWKKLDKESGVVIPESMLDVRDMCNAVGAKISPDMSIEEMGRIVKTNFDADIGIWGSVERVPGHEWDVYDLTIRCVDFTSENEPKVIFEADNVRTETVSEIPHLYVKNMLDKLFDRREYEAMADPIAEKNWRENPNLVVGGDFEKGRNGVPLGWEDRGGQHREPLGNLVRWTTDSSDSTNKVIRHTFGPSVGNGYGVMYYSLPFPIEEGAKYRFQCRWRSNGPAVKIFIKCYDQMDSEYVSTERLRDITAPERYTPTEQQLRECYRAQMNMKGPKNAWNTHTQDFTPKHTKYSPKWGKVDLYAYLGGGVVEFDDVVIKQIVGSSAGSSNKMLRHSMESDVTLEEMRENEERARREEEESSP